MMEIWAYFMILWNLLEITHLRWHTQCVLPYLSSLSFIFTYFANILTSQILKHLSSICFSRNCSIYPFWILYYIFCFTYNSLHRKVSDTDYILEGSYHREMYLIYENYISNWFPHHKLSILLNDFPIYG